MVPELDCENDLTNPIRLGPKNIGNKPRLMKITVKTEETKKKILSNVSRLNNSKTDPRKRIYINQDYTNKEREPGGDHATGYWPSAGWWVIFFFLKVENSISTWVPKVGVGGYYFYPKLE